MSARSRLEIERAFGCLLQNEYGASECLAIAHGCREGCLHVDADWVILEPVDREFKPTPPGELFYVVLRLYQPQHEHLEFRYSYPPLRRR